MRSRTATVVPVDLALPLAPLGELGHPEALLVVRHRRATLGSVAVPAGASPDEQRAAIRSRLGGSAGRTELRARLRERLSGGDGGEPAGQPPGVSVIVCTRDRTDQLAACLAGLLALDPPALEVVVVDNAPSDQRTRALCAELPLRYVVEPIPGQTRARNRGLLETAGELVAFTDDDCVADPDWLAGLRGPFADSLVMAVTGHIAPLELAAPAQYAFEAHGGFERQPERRTFEGLARSPALGAAVAGAGANMVFRRTAFEAVGAFAEDLGPGTPARSADDKEMLERLLAAGYRVVHDPAQRVWHRHRADWPGLHRIMNDYGVAELAWTARALRRRRDPGALRIWRWWIGHLARDPFRGVPPSLTLEEIKGAAAGLTAPRRAAASRRGIAPLKIVPSAPASTAVKVSGAEAPALSVAVASYNRRESLRLTLEALGRQDYPRERFEVVLTLDGSTDGSEEMARALDVPYDVAVHTQPNRGLASARNHGAWTAAHPVVVFLDDDIRPAPGFLAAHAEAQRSAAAPGLALGHYPPADAGRHLAALAVRAWWADHFRRLAEPGHRWAYTDICDGNASVPVELLRRLGGFDEEFSGGRRRQDWELGVRVLDSGIPVSFHPSALGDHHLDSSVATMLRNARQEGRDDVLLGQKHPHARALLPASGLPAREWLAYVRGERWRRLRRLAALPRGPERALAALEGVGLRSRWALLLHRLWCLEYGRGLCDALPATPDLTAFLHPATLEWEELAVSLDRDAPPATARPSTRPLRVRIEHGGRTLATLPAVEAGGQWDLDALVDRLVEALEGTGAGELMLDELGLVASD